MGRGSGENGVEKLEVRGGATKRGDNVTTIRRRWRRRRPEAVAAGSLHANNTRSRQGEAAVSAAGTAAARSGAAAVASAEAAVGLLP